MYSKDCKNWVEISLPKESVQLYSAPIYANGQFIMWGYKDSKKILFYSNDGDTWDVITIDVCPGQDHNMAFGDNKFVTVSSEGLCALSTDGLNWTDTHERLYQNDINVTNNVKDIILEDAIIAPVAAEIGQFLVVKAVDKHGKPIEWETVDMSNSGSTPAEYDAIILKSSTAGSSKKFRLTIGDDGVLSAEEVIL